MAELVLDWASTIDPAIATMQAVLRFHDETRAVRYRSAGVPLDVIDAQLASIIDPDLRFTVRHMLLRHFTTFAT